MMHSTEIHGSESSRAIEYLAGWQRARAELQNARKRFSESQVANGQMQRAQALTDLLPIADNFRTLAMHIPVELESDSWAQGVLHVEREFSRLLQELGVQVINPEREAFDPLIHEAVEQVEGGIKNTVVDVVQVGYMFGDTVLRPAKVKVAK